MLLAFVPASSTEAVLSAVSGLKSFIEEGSGIAFTLAAERIEVKRKSSLS